MKGPQARLSFLYASLFFELGINLPFFPLWLRARNLDDGAIGIVLAAPLLMRAVANPLMGTLADRSGRPSVILACCAATVAAGTGLFAFVDGFLPILLVVAAVGLAQGPLIALTDAIALRLLGGTALPELRYGRIRLWGSVGFAAANLSVGWALDWLPASTIIALLFGSAMATLLATLAVAALASPEPRPARLHPQDGNRGSAPTVIALVILGAALVQASHAAFYGFSVLHWQEQGLSGSAMGGLWAAAVMSEILVLGLLGLLMRDTAAATMLLLASAAAATLRWLGMAFDPAPALLLPLQMMHGITFGATHVASIFLLARLAPADRRTQVQSWLAALWAIAMAGLTALCGRLYAEWGERIYWFMAASSMLGFALLAIAAARLRAARAEQESRQRQEPAPSKNGIASPGLGFCANHPAGDSC